MPKFHDVLVLNRSYVPVQITSYKKVMGLIVQDHARSLDREFISYPFDDWLSFTIANGHGYQKLHTVKFPVALPEIIVLTRYNRLPNRDVKFTRQNVFSRDHHVCQYCGRQFKRDELEIEHVIPKCQGGRSTWDNVVSACSECNARKANRTPEEAGMKLKRKPQRPKWVSVLNNHVRSGRMCISWQHFMDRVETSFNDGTSECSLDIPGQ